MKENKIFAVANLDAEDLGSSIIRTYWTNEGAYADLEKIEAGTHEEFFKNAVCDVFEISLPEPVNPTKEQEETVEQASREFLFNLDGAYEDTDDAFVGGASFGFKWQSHQSGHIKNLHKMLADVNEMVKLKDAEIERLRNEKHELHRFLKAMNLYGPHETFFKQFPQKK